MFVAVIVAFVKLSPTFLCIFPLSIEVFFISNIKSVESIKSSIEW